VHVSHLVELLNRSIDLIVPAKLAEGTKTVTPPRR
jgi:hypothetical protein